MKELINEKMIKKSNITLLIISVIFLLVSIIIGNGSEEFVPTELCSVIVLYYSIVYIFNNKSKNFVFKLGIVESISMMLFILLDRSLFIIIYFLL